jgi:hypothetical protein
MFVMSHTQVIKSMYSYAAAMEELNDDIDDINYEVSSSSGGDSNSVSNRTVHDGGQSWAKILMSSKTQADADLAVSTMMGSYWTDFAKVNKLHLSHTE